MMDEEPNSQPDEANLPAVRDTVWLRPAMGTALDRYLNLDNSQLYDNAAPENARAIPIGVIENDQARSCCANAANGRLQPQRYGAPVFMGNVLPDILERLCDPLTQPGLPMGGRCALSFSDSRQGVAWLAAKLQQDAEWTLTRAFLYHAVQEEQETPGEKRAALESQTSKISHGSRVVR
jgi:DEAD/DEAH box helicase domain-containing protein